MSVTETLPAKMTDKEEAFCLEYVIDKNKAQAAIRAGYSEKTAKEIGYKKFTKVHIRNRIKELLAQTHEELDISRERVMREYSRLAFHNPKNFYKEDGTLKKITELDDDTAAAITGFDVTKIGDVGNITKIKMADKKSALDSLAKTFDMFGEGSSQEVGVAIEVEGKEVAMRIAFLLKKAEK